MENKLGLDISQLLTLERKVVNIKLNLLDETFTFNETEFNFEYLKKINDYLFGDFYFDKDLGYRDFSHNKNIIEKKLDYIINLSLSRGSNEEILNSIYEIWCLQPFLVGNTRTLLAFLKILNSAFLLGLEIDFDKEISSSPKMFEINNFVNQKTLTMHK